MARLFADENFPRPCVEKLRELGHDVETVLEAGKAGLSLTDVEVLELAGAGDRAIVTLNRKHFVHLHAARPAHAGIIVCTFDRDFSGQALRIHAAIASMSELRGQLVRVTRGAPTTDRP